MRYRALVQKGDKLQRPDCLARITNCYGSLLRAIMPRG
jgi:hypothetical protein